MSDEYRRILEQMEFLRRIQDPIRDLQREIDQSRTAYESARPDSKLLDFLREEEERRKTLAGVLDIGIVEKSAAEGERIRQLIDGPMEAARQQGLLDPNSEIRRSMAAAAELRTTLDHQFRLPVLDELNQMSDLWKGSASQEIFERSGSLGLLTDVMAQMQNPWLSIDQPDRSAGALAELIAIGRMISERPPFDQSVSEILRSSLGDWRNFVLPSPITLSDPANRSRLYRDLGFDGRLTEFTEDAFEEGLELADLDEPNEEAEGEQRHANETAIEEPQENQLGGQIDAEGFQRAQKAFQKLQGFEISLRRFIENVMRDAYGTDWMKRRVPDATFKSWIEKRAKALKAGQPEQPLIDYADFNDYRIIIERTDNWKDVFSKIFGRREDIQESLVRLSPIRVATMHARIVTLDDELLLAVEMKRILKAIERPKR